MADGKDKRRTGRPPGTGPIAGDVLEPMMRRFIDEYILDFNGMKAARRAGYAAGSAGSLRVQAARTLKNPAAKTYLAELMTALDEERAGRRQRIVDELEKIAFFNPADVMDMSGRVDMDFADDPELAYAAVASIKEDRTGAVTHKFVDKTRALELLGKHEGMWIDRTEVSGPKGGPVPVTSTEMTAKEAAELWAAQIGRS